MPSRKFGIGHGSAQGFGQVGTCPARSTKWSGYFLTTGVSSSITSKVESNLRVAEEGELARA